MRIRIAASALITLSACVQDVGKGKVAAEVADVPEEEAAAPATPAAGKTLPVDVSKSSIDALGAKVTATHPITWKSWNGSVTVDGQTLTAVTFTVDMNTMEADHPKLTAHLKDKDFFDVPTFPEATFQSTSITEGAKAEGDWTHTVSGDFTIRGVTKRVSFPAKVSVDDSVVKASTEFVIDRQDFKVSYPGRPDDLVQDNVRMNVAFVAPRS